LTDFALYSTVSACGSATRTAPPASKAPPAAVAANFARANFTDMGKLFCSCWGFPHIRRFRCGRIPVLPLEHRHPASGNHINHETNMVSRFFDPIRGVG
jgi:hypothetical protein